MKMMRGILEMARYLGIDGHMVDLDIEDEENEKFIFKGNVGEEINKYDFCLVRHFFSKKNIYDRAMKSKMTDV